jgi:ClpP class serine protease
MKKMKNHLLAKLAIKNEPWIITEEYLNTFENILNGEGRSIEAIEKSLGRELKNSYDVVMHGSVAVVSVSGPLVKYGNMFDRVSGLTSYDLLSKDIVSCMKNPEVESVVLQIDSPGGQANGISALGDIIYSFRGVKPIVAYCDGTMASGAYWMAAACDEIVSEIVSKRAPLKSSDPNTKEGHEQIQIVIDDLEAVFYNKLSLYRGISVEEIEQNYGRGGMAIAEKAVSMGLADRILSFDALLEERQNKGGLESSTDEDGEVLAQNEDITMSEDKTTASAGDSGPPITVSELKKNSPAVYDAIFSLGVDSGIKRGNDILASDEAKGKFGVAVKLFNQTSLSVENAKDILASVSAESSGGASFSETMDNLKDPDVGADTELSSSDKDAQVEEDLWGDDNG